MSRAGANTSRVASVAALAESLEYLAESVLRAALRQLRGTRGHRLADLGGGGRGGWRGRGGRGGARAAVLQQEQLWLAHAGLQQNLLNQLPDTLLQLVHRCARGSTAHALWLRGARRGWAKLPGTDWPPLLGEPASKGESTQSEGETVVSAPPPRGVQVPGAVGAVRADAAAGAAAARGARAARAGAGAARRRPRGRRARGARSTPLARSFPAAPRRPPPCAAAPMEGCPGGAVRSFCAAGDVARDGGVFAVACWPLAQALPQVGTLSRTLTRLADTVALQLSPGRAS